MSASLQGAIPCPLCVGVGGQLVFQAREWRVIRAQEPGFPAFYRVVWQQHLAEWSDLSPGQRSTCMDVVVVVEQLMREHLAPTKINLAALGNVVPHLHWHVIARFDWDSHFPAPIWAAAARECDDWQPVLDRLPLLDQALTQRLAGLV